jgi:hypothetical protein
MPEITPEEYERLSPIEKQYLQQEERLNRITDRHVAEVLGLQFYMRATEVESSFWHGTVYNLKDDTLRGPANALEVTLWQQLKSQVIDREEDAGRLALL